MDIGEFYDADPRRRESDEEQFGDGWQTEADQHSTYRANWILETGELYVVREPHPGGLVAKFLDQLDVDQADVSQLTVEVLGRFGSEAEVKQALDGWQKRMNHHDSLTWLRERAARGTAGSAG
jgi:hypothetical protein